MKFRPIAVGLLLLVATASLATARADDGCDPTDPPTLPQTETLDGDHGRFEGITGHWMPSDQPDPKVLIAFFHGYGNDSRSWACHIQDASEHHAVSFALDYRGTTGDFRETRGWFVKEGAEDSILVANFLLEKYPTIETVISFGISMGGNASGVAVARNAKRADGSPLFDHWFDLEGVNDLAEEYALANAVAPVNATGAQAVADINEECERNYDGDTVACLADLTVVAHSKDIADGGLRGAVIVHGIDDGLVPTNQSREMSTGLRAFGVPVEQYTVLRRNVCASDDEPCIRDQGGTTFTQNIGDPLFEGAGLGTYPRPLAGHGWEGSDSHLVIATGFNRLWDLLEHGTAPANHEFLVDGEVGTIPAL